MNALKYCPCLDYSHEKKDCELKIKLYGQRHNIQCYKADRINF